MNSEAKRTFSGYANSIFYEFAQKKPGSVNLIFSRAINYPVIHRRREAVILMPLPRIKENTILFEGLEFENVPEEREVLWALFLASIYHLGAHAAVSDYGTYENWTMKKTIETCNKVIDFIEDSFVEDYISRDMLISKNLSEIKNEVAKMDENRSKDISQKSVPWICSSKDRHLMNKLSSEIMNSEGVPTRGMGLLKVADALYGNRHLLPKRTLPYCEQDGNSTSIIGYKKNCLRFNLDEEFKETIRTLDDLWQENENMRTRLIRVYGKHLKGLHFDSITLPSENYHEFVQIRDKIMPMLRRIRQQLRMIANVTDSPKTNQMGQLDMQMAIQAISSKGQVTDVYEFDEERRLEEAWVILIDKSASMGLRFDHVKEFAICVAEAANELTGSHDAWAMYSFDNNFQILKDFHERYGQQIQARLGGLQNSGLSLLPDAIDLSYRILASDPREKKFLFVITDGHPSGYDRINEQFSKISKKVEHSGVIMVAIGISKSTSKKFRNNARGTDLRELVAKFITAYRAASSNM